MRLGELIGVLAVEPFFGFGGLELLDRLPERLLDARRAVQAVEQRTAGVSKRARQDSN